MDPYDLARIIGLQQTFPLVIMGFFVFYNWYPSAIKAIREKETLTYYDYLIIGVCFSMANKFTDPVYWGIPWSLDYINHQSAAWFFKMGAYSNVLCRQFFGVGAVFFHLLGTYKAMKINKTHIMSIVIISNLAGIAWVIFLSYYKIKISTNP